MDTWIGEKLRCFLEFLDSDLIRCLKFSRWRLAQDILKDGGDAVDKLKNLLENPTALEIYKIFSRMVVILLISLKTS